MPGRPHVYSGGFTTDVPESAANTETAAFTIPGCQSEFPGQAFTISGCVMITCGTTATAMTVRIRRGSLTGALVGEAIPAAGNIAASKATPISFFAQDTPSDTAGIDYVVTFQGTGEGTAAAANGGAGTCVVA